MPLNAGDIALEEAFLRTADPFRQFMAVRIDPETFESLASLRPDPVGALGPDVPLSVLVPSFMLSEVAPRISDRVPDFPAIPDYRPCRSGSAYVDGYDDGAARDRLAAVQAVFFFVIADGWRLISEALVRSYF